MEMLDGMRSGRGVIFGLFIALALAGCNKSNEKVEVGKPAAASEAGQRVYLDPVTGKMRTPTEAEKAAAAATAKKQQQESNDAQQKAQLEKRDRIEKIPGGGTLLHLGPQDWPQEKLELKPATQGEQQP